MVLGMDEIPVKSWTEFETELQKLREEIGESGSPVLFRGQADASWPLSTTLERSGSEDMRFSDYYQLITAAIRPAVATLSSAGPNIPEYDGELEGLLKQEDSEVFRRFPPMPLYEYMVYLRHHGFPSPLLDWSHSPYVAAFFAFREPMRAPGQRAVYAFCEMPHGHKGGWSAGPRIRQIGSYVRSHRRHFQQQSDYTICGLHDKWWRFHSHDAMFSSPQRYRDQDLLWKFVLPSIERLTFLRILDRFNINAFSLFGSEETLMETVALRELILKPRTA